MPLPRLLEPSRASVPGRASGPRIRARALALESGEPLGAADRAVL